MRYLLLTAALLSTSSAFATRQTLTEATGNDVVIQGTVTPCLMPDPFAPKHDVLPTFETTTSFNLKVCRESRTYEADVTGSFWNTKTAEIPGTSRLSYAVADSAQSVSYPVNPKEGKDGQYKVKASEWAFANVQLIYACAVRAQAMANAAVPLQATKCQ